MNSAVPVLRAGLTEVFVTGMLLSVRARPMAMPAKPISKPDDDR